MNPSDLNRRDFNKLTMAAFGGVLAGSVAGCGGGGGDGKGGTDEKLMLAEPHVCKGLNACKGKGKGGGNECAGQGACATAKEHSCKGSNECKGQGGCKETAGINSCKGKGECAVPLKEDAWKKARARFEKLMKAEKKKDIGNPSE